MSKLRIRATRTPSLMQAAGDERTKLELMELFALLQDDIAAAHQDPEARDCASVVASVLEGRARYVS